MHSDIKGLGDANGDRLGALLVLIPEGCGLELGMPVIDGGNDGCREWLGLDVIEGGTNGGSLECIEGRIFALGFPVIVGARDGVSNVLGLGDTDGDPLGTSLACAPEGRTLELGMPVFEGGSDGCREGPGSVVADGLCEKALGDVLGILDIWASDGREVDDGLIVAVGFEEEVALGMGETNCWERLKDLWLSLDC